MTTSQKKYMMNVGKAALKMLVSVNSESTFQGCYFDSWKATISKEETHNRIKITTAGHKPCASKCHMADQRSPVRLLPVSWTFGPSERL